MVFLQSVLGASRAVLFDEPTSGLDPESRRLMWNIMLALFERRDTHASSRACVLTTHSLEEAEALCTRIAILIHGKIYAIGAHWNYMFLLFHINGLVRAFRSSP